jgi:hypothetical protein
MVCQTVEGKNMRNVILLGTVLGIAAVVLWQREAAGGNEEEPQYRVSAREGSIEIREYPALIAAEVSVSGLGRDAENDAFRILAGYIFGKNRQKAKVAMTVPVTEEIDRRGNEKIAMTVPVTEQVASDGMRMRFFMPSKYTMESLPEPLDGRIKFVEVPPQRFAVIRFSGFASEHSIREHTDELIRWLGGRHLSPKGELVRAFYNPPWTLPFLRRNEVWVPLESDS